MDISKPAKFLKNPWVIAIGIGLALVLILASRKTATGGSSNADITLASQQVGSSTNVALAGLTTDYNKAALSFQLGMAQTAADLHAGDVGANTAITLSALSTFNNLGAAEAQARVIREQNAGAIAINAQNTASYLDLAKNQSQTMITLAPHAEALANISANAAIQQALIARDGATTIADINAALGKTVSENDVRKTKVNAISSMWNGFFHG